MQNSDLSKIGESSISDVISNSIGNDLMGIHGRYEVKCFDKDGNLKWRDVIDNLVTDEGKKFILDLCFGTGTYSSSYMGLISSVGYTAVAVGDTAAQINGTNAWKEAGTASNFPLIGGTTLRLAPSWAAAAKNTNVDKATSAAVSFTIGATGGTLKGCIIVINGTSALGNATGKLYSAGTFSGGDKVVSASDTLNVSYTTSLT